MISLFEKLLGLSYAVLIILFLVLNWEGIVIWSNEIHPFENAIVALIMMYCLLWYSKNMIIM